MYISPVFSCRVTISVLIVSYRGRIHIWNTLQLDLLATFLVFLPSTITLFICDNIVYHVMCISVFYFTKNLNRGDGFLKGGLKAMVMYKLLFTLLF